MLFKNDQLKQIVDQNPHFTTKDIADIVNVSKGTVFANLKKIGYVSKLDVWVPHQLTGAQLTLDFSMRFVAETSKKTTLF